MRSTKIVTSFIQDKDRFLILKRSKYVKTMKCLWAGISGIIENDEEPQSRAKIEIFEELGITADRITLVKAGPKTRIISPQYKNHEWEIFPFLFLSENPEIILNWENSEYKWIRLDDIIDYQTVPNLEQVLRSLL